jgi:hypothetical protein
MPDARLGHRAHASLRSDSERALALLVIEKLVDGELAAFAAILGDFDRCARRALEVGAAPLLAVVVVRRLVGDRPPLDGRCLGAGPTGFPCGCATGTCLSAARRCAAGGSLRWRRTLRRARRLGSCGRR